MTWMTSIFFKFKFASKLNCNISAFLVAKHKIYPEGSKQSCKYWLTMATDKVMIRCTSYTLIINLLFGIMHVSFIYLWNFKHLSNKLLLWVTNWIVLCYYHVITMSAESWLVRGRDKARVKMTPCLTQDFESYGVLETRTNLQNYSTSVRGSNKELLWLSGLPNCSIR